MKNEIIDEAREARAALDGLSLFPECLALSEVRQEV